MAEEKKSKKGQLVRVYDPELEYVTDLEKSIALSILFFIVLFLTVKHVEVSAYVTKAATATQVEEINLEARLEETPPPAAQAKPQVPKQIEEAGPGEEVSSATTDTVDIGPTTFNEAELPPPPQEDTVYEFSIVQVKPQLIKKVLPEYPELARKAGLEGKVIVELVVGKDGQVKDARILKSDNEIFNQAALDAVKQYVFKPAMQNDKPVSVRVLVPIVFTLER